MERQIEVVNRKAHFVLVHGASHGAWCWYRLRCLLENHGHKVTCLDLASAGINPSNPNYILTFDEYNMPLSTFLSNLPNGHKVILVGHSAGGLSVSHAIHKFGCKISVAVFVGATMLKSGFCTIEDTKTAVPDISEYGDKKNITENNGVLKEDFQRKLFYNLSPREDAVLASMLLKPPPPSSVFQSAQFEGGEADKVRRVYVKTLQDRTVKPHQQEAMIERWPPSEVYSLENDHSPFFSAPSQLCDVLLKISAQ